MRPVTTPFQRALRVCRRSNRSLIRAKGNLTAVIVYIHTYHSLDVEYWADDDIRDGWVFSPGGYISLLVEKL